MNEGDPFVFDWNVHTIYMKGEGSVFKLIVRVNGNPFERVVHPEDFTFDGAHETLISKGFDLNERFVDIDDEGCVDVYVNDSVKAPPPHSSMFSWSKAVLLKVEGAVAKLFSKPDDSTGSYVKHKEDFKPSLLISCSLRRAML